MELLLHLLMMKRHPNKKSYGENVNSNFNAFMEKRCEDLIEADNILFKNALKLALIFAPKRFLYLGVVSSSEDDEEVPFLSLSF